MALFGFSDILFNKNPSNFNKGPLAGLQGDNKFSSRSYRYPLDIGNADKGHYMVIYIRQQNNSTFSSETVSDDSINEKGSSQTSINVVNNILQGKPSVSFANEFVQKLNGGANKINESTNGVLSGLTSTISRGLGDVARGLESGINNVFGQASKSLTGDSVSTQTIINYVQSITSQLNTRRIADTKFFMNSSRIVDEYNFLTRFSNIGATQEYLINNVIGTENLKTKLATANTA